MVAYNADIPNIINIVVMKDEVRVSKEKYRGVISFTSRTADRIPINKVVADKDFELTILFFKYEKQ